MKKSLVVMLLAGLMVLGLATLALAAVEKEVAVAGLNVFSSIVIAAGFGIAAAAAGTGLGQGMAIKAALEGTARNPEASGKIQVTMLIGLALIESLCIYALVVALILLFAYPMTDPIAKMLGIAG